MQPSILSAAEDLVVTTALDVQEDPSEPWDLCKLRALLAEDRERLQAHLENPDSPYASHLGLDGLFWALRFSWADVQDYVEEANAREMNIAAGFPDVPYHWTELPDGRHVPCRAQINRYQTLHDYQMWSGSEEVPVVSWVEEDYEAATWPTDDEDERVPWEDYDQDDLRKMDRALARGY